MSLTERGAMKLTMRRKILALVPVSVVLFFFVPFVPVWPCPAGTLCPAMSLLASPSLAITGVLTNWNSGYGSYYTASAGFVLTFGRTVLSSNRIACRAQYYSVLGKEYIEVQNRTTYTSFTVFTSSSTNTFTTTSDYQNAGYVTSTSFYVPPSAWEVITCTYG